MTQRYCDHCAEPAVPEDVLRSLTQDGISFTLPATDSHIDIRLRIDHNFGGPARPDLCRVHLFAMLDAIHGRIDDLLAKK